MDGRMRMDHADSRPTTTAEPPVVKYEVIEIDSSTTIGWDPLRQAQNRIVHLENELTASERRADDAVEARDVAEIEQEKLLDQLIAVYQHYEAQQQSTTAQILTLHERLDEAVTTSSEWENRAKGAIEEADRLRVRLHELDEEDVIKANGQLERDKADLMATLDDVSRRLAESEKQRAMQRETIAEAEQITKGYQKCRKELRDDLEDAEQRVKMMEREREQLLKKAKDGTEASAMLDELRAELIMARAEAEEGKNAVREKNELRSRWQNSLQQRGEDKRKIDEMEKEIVELKGKMEHLPQLEADMAFFKGQKKKLEAELKEKREEVERMGRTDNGRIIEYVERELGRRLDAMTAINRDIARQRDQMEMEKACLNRKNHELEERVKEMEFYLRQERGDAAVTLARAINEKDEDLRRERIANREAEERVKEESRQLAQKQTEAEKERARLATVTEELEELRRVNAFLASTPAGKLHEELQQSREREAELTRQVETLARLSAMKKEDEEWDGDELKRKRNRRDVTKDGKKKVVMLVELEDGEIVDEQQTDFSISASPAKLTTPPPFLTDYMATKQQNQA